MTKSNVLAVCCHKKIVSVISFKPETFNVTTGLGESLLIHCWDDHRSLVHKERQHHLGNEVSHVIFMKWAAALQSVV